MNIRSGNFNPLPPHGGRRVYLDRRKTKWKFQSTPSAWRETRLVIIPFNARFTFQSTPSAWRETACCPAAFLHYRYFNPLPPHGGRQALNIGFPQCSHISIHSLRMEGDAGYSYSTFSVFLFQSTPSAWRETIHVKRYRLRVCISIHSLRMEGDASGVVASFALYISIHSLRMEGDYSRAYIDLASGISIHSLRMEGDANSFFSALYLLFQSTPSAWRETRVQAKTKTLRGISIHSLRMEGDYLIIPES